ncbi:MAG: IS21 family transposase [Syntrophaceae bacterium]
MLKKEDWMEIKALVEKGVYKKDIAEELGVHPKTVSRALGRGGPPGGERPRARHSKLDPFKPFIDSLLCEGVWNGMVILRELQTRGYTGGSTIIRDYIKPKRSLRERKATVRFETLPGEQLQHDWGETVTIVAGRRQRVFFNVNTLGYSRRFYFWCTDSNDAEHTYEGIVRAFEHFGGVVKEVLVDNQKSAVIAHRIGEAVRFNGRFCDLAGLYGFTPRACRPYRARTKGKDERMVGYIKHNFFVRYRRFESFAHMNQLALAWLTEEADKRMHGTVREIVEERFLREAPSLCPLPAVRYDTAYHETRLASWDGYVDVGGNRYSIPDDVRGAELGVRITLDGLLTVFNGEKIVAEHRMKDRTDGWVTIPEHHEGLWQSLHVEHRDLSVYEEVAQCN